MTSFAIGILAGVTLAVAAAAPAGAIDNMTGSYTGNLSCKGYAGGTPSKSKHAATAVVVEDETIRLRLSADGAPFGDTVSVFRLPNETKPDRAKIQGLDCPSTSSSPQSLTIEGDVVIKPGSEKGTIKGSLIRRDSLGMPAAIEVCTFALKRTSTELPEVLPCPPI
jgi:hypothetical protein